MLATRCASGYTTAAYRTMLTPSAIANGTITRRCSRTTRWSNVPPCTSLATRPLRTHVRPANHRFQQPVVVGRLERRDHVAKAAGFLERLDELVNVLRSARLDGNLDDELPFLRQRRIDRGNPHVVRERLFELIEELAPRESALVDDAVGFAGGAGNRFQLLRVDLRANRCRLPAKARGVPLRFRGAGAEYPLTAGQADQFRDIEGRHGNRDDEDQSQNELYRALVVEGARRKVCAKHQAV